MKYTDFEILANIRFNYHAIGLHMNYIITAVDMQDREVVIASPLREYVIDLDRTDFIDYLESNDHLERDTVINRELEQIQIDYEDFIELVDENEFCVILSNFFMGKEHFKFEQILKNATSTALIADL